MVCKIIEIEHFEPNKGIYWLRCGFCAKHLNIFSEPVLLKEPYVFGESSNKPESATHSCFVKCRCEKTVVKMYGHVEKLKGIGCAPGGRSGQ